MFVFLCYSATLVIERARYLDLELHMLLGLPGINPFIPLWYGIFGLVIAMMVHEFSHGILASLAKVKIKSLGILVFIVPMGAFVEPDEDELKQIEKKKRVRMFSAGPAANIITAGICAFIFSVILMGGVQPAFEGVGITGVGDGTPAEYAILEPGMIMVSFNGTRTNEYTDFRDAVEVTRANQTVLIGIYDPDTDSISVVEANLTDKGNITGKEEDNGLGYLGVTTMTASTAHFHPIGGAEELGGLEKSIAMYVILPLQGLSPVQGAAVDFYEITGFWSNIPGWMFWILANAVYWVFWLNLMIGLTNALPAVPLDGGYIFKDWLDSFFQKFKSFQDAEQRTKAVDKIVIALALTILFLILWQVIGPRLLTA
ncbi:MAG: site-2 protease family protein, partial [Thermoplasmata archaeon]|nr:site-2 protease family protein [Thermoplasmata archaeon]